MRRWTLRALAVTGLAGAAVLVGSTASAEEPAGQGDGVSDLVGGLLGGAGDTVLDPVVDDVVSPAVEDVVAPVTVPVTRGVVAPVVDEVAPVLDPLLSDVVEPVVRDVPVTDPLVEDVVAPALQQVEEAVAPVTDPVVQAVEPVTEPITEAVEPVTDPVKEIVAPSTGPEDEVVPAPLPAPSPAPAPVVPEPSEPVPTPLPSEVQRPDLEAIVDLNDTVPAISSGLVDELVAVTEGVSRELALDATAMALTDGGSSVPSADPGAAKTDADQPTVTSTGGAGDKGSPRTMAAAPGEALSSASSAVRGMTSDPGVLSLILLPALAVVWLAAGQQGMRPLERFQEVPTSPA